MTNDEIDSLIASEQTILNLINARLEETLANPQPSYSIDGETWSLNEYQDMLMNRKKTIQDLILSWQKMKNIFNPYLIKSIFR